MEAGVRTLVFLVLGVYRVELTSFWKRRMLWSAVIGAVFLGFLYYVCLRPAAGSGAEGSASQAKNGAGSNKGFKKSDSYAIKEKRFAMLLETSRKRYIQLHPEFETKLKELETSAEKPETTETTPQGKLHQQ